MIDLELETIQQYEELNAQLCAQACWSAGAKGVYMHYNFSFNSSCKANSAFYSPLLICTSHYKIKCIKFKIEFPLSCKQ